MVSIENSEARFLNPYEARRINVVDLGFASINDYMASDTWRRIKRETLAECGYECYACGMYADQVHHSSYDTAVLSGRDTSHLYPVCDACHKWAHSGTHKILPPGVATARLTNARNTRLRSRRQLRSERNL